MSFNDGPPKIYKAIHVWNSFYTDRECSFDHVIKGTYAEFLGGFTGRMGNLRSWALSPTGIAKIDMLLSPHARTIVKAYFALHPELPKPPLL